MARLRVTSGQEPTCTRKFRRNEDGAHLVELAIALPLFVGFLFVTFDTARVALAYSAVRTAVYQASRRAIATDRPVEHQSFQNVFPTPASMATPADLTFYPFIHNSTVQWHVNNNPAELFRVEALSLGYAYSMISRNLGALRWPCDNAASCAACTVMRDKIDSYQKLFCEYEGQNCLRYRVNYLGLQCTVNVPIAATSVALGWLPRFIRIQATTYVAMDNYTAVLFDNNYNKG